MESEDDITLTNGNNSAVFLSGHNLESSVKLFIKACGSAFRYLSKLLINR